MGFWRRRLEALAQNLHAYEGCGGEGGSCGYQEEGGVAARLRWWGSCGGTGDSAGTVRTTRAKKSR